MKSAHHADFARLRRAQVLLNTFELLARGRLMSLGSPWNVRRPFLDSIDKLEVWTEGLGAPVGSLSRFASAIFPYYPYTICELATF